VPFVKITHDKRGYAYLHLIHTPAKRGRASRSRLLYWFRTPPGVKVGRAPFDDDVRRALAARHPDVAFDWEALAKASVPSIEVEHWRQRRRDEQTSRKDRRRDRVELEDEESRAGEEPEEAAAAEPDALAAAPPDSHSVEVVSIQTVEPAPPAASPQKVRRRRRGRRGRGRSEPGMERTSPGRDQAPADPAGDRTETSPVEERAETPPAPPDHEL
jgi:hypothetical protein